MELRPPESRVGAFYAWGQQLLEAVSPARPVRDRGIADEDDVELIADRSGAVGEYRLPMVCAGQNFVGGELRNVFGREHFRPWNARVRADSRAGAAEFSIKGRLLGVRLFLVVPTFRAHRIRHLGTDKNRFREVSPRSAEIRFHAWFAGDFAIGENKAVRLILRG